MEVTFFMLNKKVKRRSKNGILNKRVWPSICHPERSEGPSLVLALFLVGKFAHAMAGETPAMAEKSFACRLLIDFFA